jgi:hypothetical protein
LHPVVLMATLMKPNEVQPVKVGWSSIDERGEVTTEVTNFAVEQVDSFPSTLKTCVVLWFASTLASTLPSVMNWAA